MITEGHRRGEGAMSQTNTYEVEEIDTDTEVIWMRCRRCDRIWNVFEGAFRGSWRCPGEPHDDQEDNTAIVAVDSRS
jgi:hypothetical protein